MWFYELNQKAFGPVSQETITDELKAGRISRQTLVWRQGWPQWQHLGETELAALAGPIPPPLVAETPPPVYPTVQKTKKTTPSSLTQLFWWWFSLNLFCLPYEFFLIFAFQDISSPNLTLMGLSFLCYMPLFAGAVLHYIMIYKLWQVVQDGFARTTPGQAVGFMFIPYFNYYWFLPAYYGLAKDLNAYIDRHYAYLPVGQLRKAHPKLVLSYVISLWASIVMGMVLGMAMYISLLSKVTKMGIQGISFLAIAIPLMVISTILFVFEIVVCFDFYRSAKSILTIETHPA
jgi:hypothetical protein